MELVKMANGGLRGYTQDDDRAYKRFKGWLDRLGGGEYFTLIYKRPRSHKFHRKFFKMLRHAFDHWDPQEGRKRLTYRGKPIAKDFDAFREQVLILAGFYVQTFDLRTGKMQLRAKSIAYEKLDDDEFAVVYNAVFTVLLEHVLNNYSPDDLDQVVSELERFQPT
jgi:uncharacterized protein DUF1367